MTSLAKIRKTIKQLSNDIKKVEKELEEAVQTISINKRQPYDNKKEK